MRHLTIGVLVSAALWTIGCSPPTTSPSVTATSEGQKTEAPAGTTAAQHNSALVRFVNADPAGKGLDIFSGKERLFSNVAYKDISPYVEAPRGVNRFKLREAAGTEDLATGQREMFPGRHYTLVALPGQKRGVRLATLSDNLGLLDPGEARVRMINATTDVGDLDLFVAGTPNRILHGSDAGTVATTSFTDMDAGTVEIRSPGRPAPTLVRELKVEADRLYTFIVVGTASALDIVQIVDRTEP